MNIGLQPDSRARVLFSETWWLEAAGGPNLEIVTIENREVSARIPIFRTWKLGLAAIIPPPYTRICEPSITPLTKADLRPDQVASLLKQALTPFSRYQRLEFVLNPASPLAISFAELGFKIEENNTFVTPALASCDDVWIRMHPKLRSSIRTSEKLYRISEHTDIERYKNLSTRAYAGRDRHDYRSLLRLWSVIDLNQCGMVISATDSCNLDVAAAVLVWDRRTLYYLLSARLPEPHSNGVNALLVWHAVRIAQRSGLQFDLDGYHTVGALRFLSRFGLTPAPRKRVSLSKLGWKTAELGRDIYYALKARAHC